MSSGTIVAAQARKKQELIALLTQITLKVSSSGVILVVASQFAMILTDAVGPQLSTKILLGSVPAELVRMVSRLHKSSLCSSV